MSLARPIARRWLALIPIALLAPPATAQQTASSPEEPSLQVLFDWRIYHDAAWRFLNRGEYARAEERFTMAIRTLAPYHATSQRILARSYADLARVLYYEGRYAEAEPLARWSLTARENHPQSTPESIFESLYVLGVINRAQKHYKEARSLLERALAIQEKAVSRDNPSLAMTIEELALINREDARFDDSEKLYKRAIALREKQKIPNDLDMADASDDYAQLLIRMHRPAEARPWQDKARSIRDAAAEKDRQAAEQRAAKGFRGLK